MVERNLRRRRLIRRGLYALVLNNLIGTGALYMARQLGLATMPVAQVAGLGVLALLNFAGPSVWLALRTEITRRFADAFRAVTSTGQIAWTALALLVSAEVRPLGLVLTSIMFATMLRGVRRVEAALVSASFALSYVAASWIGTRWLGQPDRLVEDLFYIAIWIPVALVTASLVGRAEGERRVIARQRRELEALADERTRFYQRVSHELRTPLTLLLGPLGLELEREPDNRNVRVALNQVTRLKQLVDQLLDLEALTGGSEELATEDVDLSRLSERFITAYFAAGVPQRIRVTLAAPQPVWAHASRKAVATILFNFVSNAIKHSPAGSEVCIRAERGSDGSAVLWVEDEGPGIALEDQTRLFEDFGRLRNSPRGTGLGLALTRRLAEAMQGQVGVDSAPGRGSRFFVALPVGLTTVEAAPRTSDIPDLPKTPAHLAAVAARWTEPDEALLRGPWILVVEDHDALREHVQEVLGDLGLPVVGAPDGEAAWELAQRHAPRLVVTDWMMPRLDGPGLVRRLRDAPELASTPIVLLTANSDEENRRLGLAIGADAFIGKPFHPIELQCAVRNLLRLTDRDHVLERLQGRLRDNLLRRFLPRPLVDDIVAGTRSFDEALQARVVTLLVVDLAEARRFVRDLPVALFGEMLQDYLSGVSRAVFDQGGTIASVTGTRVVALFGAPDEAAPAEQVVNAVACARALHRDVQAGAWGVESALVLGLHHGAAAVGVVGSELRGEYTAIGATVMEATDIARAAAPGSITASKAIVDLLPAEVAGSVRSAPGADGVDQPLYVIETPSAPDTLPPSAVASLMSDDVPGYEIVRQVGRGGLGVVYAVREHHTGTMRALKVLHASLRDDQRPRFVQEAQVQMTLRHENIVPVLHLVELDQTIGLVMELVEGETLFMRLENGALPEDEAIVLFRGIVAGVAEIHANNIVHRDLKPANILIARRDEREVPMVTDFGLVRLLDVEPRTQIGVFLGTPGYAPPEQHLDARSVTRAADVWSLGVILYEMLTGRLPFVVPSPFGVPSYGAVYDTRRLPPRWRPLVARMLQPDPDRRLATAGGVLRALDERVDPADAITMDL